MPRSKNKGYGLPLYESVEHQSRCKCVTCWKGIMSPINSFPAFGINIPEVIEINDISWALKKHCDPDFEQMIPDTIDVFSLEPIMDGDDQVGTCVQYDGEILFEDGSIAFPLPPTGTYYFCLNINDQVCYSEELRMCDNIGCGSESTGLNWTTENSGCCDAITIEGDDRPGIWKREGVNSWFIYDYGVDLEAAILAQGGTNLLWVHQLFDNDTNLLISPPWPFGGGPTESFAFNGNVPSQTINALIDSSVEFDIDCGNGDIHRLKLSYNPFVTQLFQSSAWEFVYVDTVCEDLTPDVVISFTANDNLSSALINESIEYFNGSSWVQIGTNTATLSVTPGTSLLFRRIINTTCSDSLQEIYNVTF